MEVTDDVINGLQFLIIDQAMKPASKTKRNERLIIG
jgi:hypothetical protein